MARPWVGTHQGVGSVPDELVELGARALAQHDGAAYFVDGNQDGQDDYRRSARVVLEAVQRAQQR